MLEPSVLLRQFEATYGVAPELLVQAPGRVNLIGEHVDYNAGFVLPVAIDRAVSIAARSRNDQQVRLFAVRFQASDQFELGSIEPNPQQPWSNYVRGMLRGLLAAGHELRGADLLINGDVPLGAGLSSSAAIEVASGYCFQLLNQLNILGEELALLAQAAENTFVGVQSGIMDQFVSALGQADHALLIDCRDLSYQAVPIPPQIRIVVCDSRIERTLAASAYNQRRADCERAVELLRPLLPRLMHLRDLSPEQLARHAERLPPQILARARHVVHEIARTLDAASALRTGDLQRMGELMYASHRSLRDDYQVSLPQLDSLVEAARAVPGCYGSRLTGAGFGGCTVSLVEAAAVERFREQVAATYLAETGLHAEIYPCRASDGVTRVWRAS